MTNTNLQHYSGDVHFSNFSQIFFVIANMFISAAVGFCALARDHPAVPRSEDRRQLLRRYVARGGLHVRAGVSPLGHPFHATGHADDLKSTVQASTLEPGAIGDNR